MANVTLNEALVPVKTVPAYWETTNKNKGNGTSVREQTTGYKFVVREDNNEVLSCMTDEYKLIENKDIYETASEVMTNLNVDAQLSEVESFSNGAKTQFKWTLRGTKVDLGDGDVVSPEITLRNSYNGQWGLHILAGAFRILCSNGLVIGTIISRKSYKHSIYNMDLKDIEPSIQETVLSTDGIFNKDLPKLKNTKLQEKHIVGLIDMMPSNQMEAFTQYLMKDKPENYWDLLNSATWIATHSMKRSNEATHKLEQSIYPTITKWAGVA